MRIIVLASNLQRIGGIQNYNKKILTSIKSLEADVELVELLDSNIFSRIFFILNLFKKIVFHRSFIFCTHINFAPLCYFAKIFLGVRYSVSVHGIEVQNINSAIQRHALESADCIIKLFDAAEGDIQRQLSVPSERFLRIPNSVNQDHFFIKEKNRALMKRLGITEEKIILTISRLSVSERDNKGYAKVIDILPEILKELPNTKYVIVGDGDDRKFLEALSIEKGVRSAIIFAGAPTDEEMIDYYNLADIFIFLSKREGFPATVLLEALACGKPIIGGNQLGSNVFHNKYGIIVDPDKGDELMVSVRELLKNPNRFPSHTLREKVIAEYGQNAYREHIQVFLDFVNKSH